jgi:RNA polymerase sigma-70 factor (ECF subfamily)
MQKNGNKLLVEKVIKYHQGYILRIIRRFGIPVEDAEEIYQEICLSIYLSTEEFEGRNGCSIKTWLYRIVSNKCFQFHRAIRVRPDLNCTKESLDNLNGKEPFCKGKGVESAIFLSEILNSLSERERLILQLRFIDEASWEEIAIRLAIPGSTLRVQLCRLRSSIRHKFVSPI